MATILKVRRPGGEVEAVDVSDKFSCGLTPVAFERYRAATAAAGRGEVVGWELTDEAGKVVAGSDAPKPPRSYVERVDFDGSQADINAIRAYRRQSR